VPHEQPRVPCSHPQRLRRLVGRVKIPHPCGATTRHAGGELGIGVAVLADWAGYFAVACRLREEAETEWAKAKAEFEAALLGEPASAPDPD